ncbi:YueH family protein [Salinicoccus halodurans]|uniref:YueH-like protein n=1 Tax=Salinicoccus halodurans TaxID=407035 RepID=A0A0F7D403_9STAP|nr:YueH family protein [Salinicoccus halodurans]AKG73385.1 hypothetical protein AAT16_03600 [Salinicoccus halodurans]SFK81544.1 YueH-like protein [Salinicoccus halodurans]
MQQTKIDIGGATAPAYIYDNDKETYIISIPYINFSLELSQALPREDAEDEIIAHLFHMMDEDECAEIAGTLMDAADKQ